MKAWHFVGESLRDGRPVPPDGEWLVHEGELIMCESGFHASERLIDALSYAPGLTICRVEVDGEIFHDDDKLVAEKRKILWRVDGEQALRAFARWCALQVIHLWDAPEVVIEYLITGNKIVWDAARATAWAAAWDAQNKQLEKMVREARNGKTEWIFDVPEPPQIESESK